MEDTIDFDLTKVPKYVLPIMMLIFFLLSIWVISFQAQKIGYYNACKDMNLSLVYLDGVRMCGDLEQINREMNVLKQERQQAFADQLKQDTASVIAFFENQTEE